MSPSLPSGTRRRILDLLLREERSAAELTAPLDVTAAAVRQHLAALRAVGLVERRKRTGAAGRPTFLYRLTDLGRRAFPKRHDLLLTELVSVLLERHGPEAMLEVVEGAGRRLAERTGEQIVGRAPAERWDALLAWLEEEFAWEATVEPGRRGRRIVLHHCPFLGVSAERPEVCGRFFAALIGRLAGGAPVEHAPIRDGIRCCALEVVEG